ncbi:MAG: DUF6311 domain-containing protein [Novosphingobium sp.]
MKSSALAASLAMIVSVGLALAIFGLRIANPYDVSWISKDIVTGQFAWELYRADPAHWFPMVTDRYSYPMTMPLAMYDNLPLLAMAVKLLTPAGPGQLQYLGPAFVVGMALQALFAWLLLREATGRRTGWDYQLAILLGTMFFTSAPILLTRVAFTHMSLTHQWPVIASLWLYARSNRASLGRTLRDYSILEFVAGAINPYIMVMTLMIYGGFILKLSVDRKVHLRNCALLIVPVLIGALALLISGFIDPLAGSLLPGPGYGHFSANLYSPFNPMSEYFGPALLPDQLTSTSGQYEGFGYLGLGALLLVGGGLIFARFKGENGDGIFPPLLVVSFIAFLLALSTHFSFGRYSFDVALPSWLFAILAVFRSSGRFIWVVEYCLIFIAIASLIRLLKPRHAAVVLALAALVQTADLARPMTMMHDRFAAIAGSQKFTDPAYLGLGQAHDTLVVVPPWQCELWNEMRHDYAYEAYEPISNLVVENHLRTNSFYAGRTPVAQANYHCITAMTAIGKQPAERHTAYLLSPYMFGQLGAHVAATHLCDFADAFFICRGDRGQAGLTPRAQQASASLRDLTAPDTYKP